MYHLGEGRRGGGVSGVEEKGEIKRGKKWEKEDTFSHCTTPHRSTASFNRDVELLYLRCHYATYNVLPFFSRCKYLERKYDESGDNDNGNDK